MPLRRVSIAAWGGPLVAVGLAAWITAPAWGRTPFSGIDVIAHLMRAVFGVERLVMHGRLDGWSPGAFLGHQHFLIRGPGVTWLTALVRAATLGRLSTTAAFDAAVLGSFVLFPLGACFLARSLGLDRTAAGVAAILSLAVANPFCNGIRGLFGLGLVENQVGALVFVVALGALARIVADPRPRWIVVGGIATAALAITHAPSTLVLPVVAALQLPWLLAHGRARAAIGRLAVTGVLALGLAAFWALPFVAHRDLVALRIGHRDVPPLLDDLRAVLTGSLTYPPGVAWAVLAGWTFVLVRSRRDLGLAIGPLAYLVLGHGYYTWSPSEVHEQVALRAAGYTGLLAIFPLAILLSRAARSRAGEVAIVGIAVALVVVPSGPWRALVRPYPTAPAALVEAAGVLHGVVPRGARFATPQRAYPAEIVGGGLAGPDRWLSWQSDRATLNGLTRDSSSTPWTGAEAEMLDTRPPAESADRLGRLGVSHVVVPTAALAASLAASPRFRQVWTVPPLAILAIVPLAGRPAPASLIAPLAGPARAHLQSAAAEHLRWKVATSVATDAAVAVAWSPKWHAALDGHPIPLARTQDGLVLVRLPAGRSRLALDYAPDAWDRAGAAITLGTLVALVVALARYACAA